MRGLWRSRARADSSFRASSTASRTKFLMMSSPQGPRARLPKPPQKPFTPANPTPVTSVASPSSTRMPPSQRIFLISSCLPPSKSWLPSTAMTGTLTAEWISRARSCASSTRPWSVRSPRAPMRTVPFRSLISSSLVAPSPGSRHVPVASEGAQLVRLLLLRVALERGDSMTTLTADLAQQYANQQNELGPETIAFYREAMDAFDEAGVPFLVGGAYAFAPYTGIVRHTKDFDVFVRPADFDRALAAFAARGWQTERTFAHWLGKGRLGEDFVDVIFSSGNGVARVDEEWFDNAVAGEVLGRPVKLVPAEEMIWSKSFIMERERFDGGDVSHVFRSRASELDWDRLLRRFDVNGGWRVLLAHLTLFGYIYPGD